MVLAFLFPSPLFLSAFLFTLLHSSLCFSSTAGCPFVSLLLLCFLWHMLIHHLSPSFSLTFLSFTLSFFSSPSSPLYLSPRKHCAQSETLRFGVFGHPSSFLCEGGALDQGGGRNRVINVEQFWVLIVRSTAFLRDSFWVISAFKLLLPQTPGFSSPTSSGNSDDYSKALIISGNISFPSF